jgi:hypothetical protein
MLKSVLIYGSESWTLTRVDEQKLRTFERKVLRRIYGQLEKRKDGELSTIMSYVTVKLGRQVARTHNQSKRDVSV